MKKIKLDKDAQEILDAYESGEFKSVMTNERKGLIEQAAVAIFKKDKRINIRLSGRVKVPVGNVSERKHCKGYPPTRIESLGLWRSMIER